jgi:hypothetical protein
VVDRLSLLSQPDRLLPQVILGLDRQVSGIGFLHGKPPCPSPSIMPSLLLPQ